ncbi:MAG: mandelate racemase [Hyphomicrobiales bacterium]|nr:mandelate racemase [Hyphomicrobiales bacterium]
MAATPTATQACDPPLTVRAVEARAVNAPLARPVRTAVGAVETAPLVLIDIHTEEGVTGRAYIFGYAPLTLAPLRSFLANAGELLVGQPVAPAAQARAFAGTFRLLGRQGLVGMALAGLDMALWDAVGRAAGRSVAALLGGACRPLPAYDSYGSVDPAKDRKALQRSLAQGFKAIKIKLGGAGLDRDIQVVAGVREVIGDDVALMVDYNQSLGVAEAVRRIDALEEFDLAWVEEPVPAEDLAGHAEVRAATGVPIQTGENWWFTTDMAKAIAAGACDYAMPDIMKIGGVTGWLGAMGQAEAASMPVSSHLFIEASAHVLAVTPTAHWLEFLDVAEAVRREPIAVTDGTVTARGPGLGLEWDEAAVERYRY